MAQWKVHTTVVKMGVIEVDWMAASTAASTVVWWDKIEAPSTADRLECKKEIFAVVWLVVWMVDAMAEGMAKSRDAWMADWRALCWVYRQAALMAATTECDVA